MASLALDDLVGWNSFRSVLGALFFNSSTGPAYIARQVLTRYIVPVVAIPLGLVFMWWGIRLAIRALMSAFRSGRFRL